MFSTRLVNDPFGDPALFLDVRYRREALLFDLGDIRALPPRMILKVDRIFVTHTHMDHFIGFDHLLRVCLGREKHLFLCGPPGFIDNVEGKLRAYTWNLVENYENDFRLWVTELHPGRMETAVFQCREAFRPGPQRQIGAFDGTIVERDAYRVEAVFLDHKVPCLAFRLEEKRRVNVKKNALAEMGLPGGAWINALKDGIHRNEPDGSAFRVWWKGEDRRVVERVFRLGELKEKLTKITPGQRIVYVSDVIDSPGNSERIVEFARGADVLFVEACFLDEDRERAGEKYHLTARQAGRLARLAGVKRFVLFHHSPKYRGEEERFIEEARRAFEERV
ncbi:MAG: MBL fold metallo-hydrolase [Syntrophales bacterium]|nr:MBL fold metallo-hydrolase [Syntrophales bacterium]MCU0582317.1 MBL fold metallo-hydrolase [Syntrophales bacterium]